MSQSRKAIQQQLLTRQITLFQHFSTIIQRLAGRIVGQKLTPWERRLMQRELAALKKSAQSTRAQLKTSHRLSRTSKDSS